MLFEKNNIYRVKTLHPKYMYFYVIRINAEGDLYGYTLRTDKPPDYDPNQWFYKGELGQLSPIKISDHRNIIMWMWPKLQTARRN